MKSMPRQRPTVVIFDMDGTSVRHLNPHILNILEWLDNQSHKASSLINWAFKRGAQGNPLEDWETYQQRKRPRLLVHRAIHKIRRKEVDQIVEPCPGIYKVLNFLRKHQIPMGIASNGLGRGYGHDILEKFDLKDYFSATVFREDIVHSKPNPESLLLTLKKMDVTLTSEDIVWYVGDRRKDVKAALAAEAHLPCTVVPIAYGFEAAFESFAEQLTPDHIIPSYKDMHDRLRKLFAAGPSPASSFF